MRFIDSHCHLETKDFGGERDDVIARARAAGVCHLVAVGSGDGLANVENAVALAEAHADISAAIGVHPHDVAGVATGTIAAIEAIAAHPRVVAIGETGLDYHYDRSPRDTQQAAYREFIGIARRTGKPLTLHVRSSSDPARGDAHGDAQRILSEEAPGAATVVHCFTGTALEARRWLDLGAWLSFSGIVTFKGADELRRALTLTPADRILVETDCPYLAPVPYRGKRNEPAYVIETVRVIAQVRGLTLAAAAALTTDNAVTAFRLPVR